MSILSRVTSFKSFDRYVFNGVCSILRKNVYKNNTNLMCEWFSSAKSDFPGKRGKPASADSREPLSIVYSINSVKTRLKSL